MKTTDTHQHSNSQVPAGTTGQRLAALPRYGNPPAVQELLDDIDAGGGRPAMQWFRTLAHAPGLLRKYRPFGAKLLNRGKLPERIRELAILRTAARCRCRYEIEHHQPIAAVAGLSHDEIDAALCTGSPASWAELDEAVLRATDELCATANISAVPWQVLARHLLPEQLVELVLLVGHYQMVAGAMNSLGVQLDGIDANPKVQAPKPRQLPELTEDTAFFWRSGSDGRLRFLRCDDCGFYLHPPTPVCPQCLGRNIRPATVSGHGTIVSFTVNHQPWSPMPVPYVIVLVEMDEQQGLRLTSNLSGPTDQPLRIGQAVHVTFEPHGEIYLPIFVPDDPASSGAASAI